MLRTTFTLAATGAALALLGGDAAGFFPPLPTAVEPSITVVPPAASPIVIDPPVAMPTPKPYVPVIPAASVIPPLPPEPFVPPVVVVVTPPPSPVSPPPADYCPPPTGVPEPATLVGTAAGLATLAAWRRRARPAPSRA